MAGDSQGKAGATPATGGDTFLFGVATADHQCESYDDRYPDVWDWWESSRQLQRRGNATEFWDLFGDDVKRAADLKCNAFRFSIAWSRFESREGEFDKDAIAHYQELVRVIRCHQMEPVVTLHHFTWPEWLRKREHQGSWGMLAKDFPELFARYAARAAADLPDVTWWVTFNEPTSLVFGYFRAFWDDDYRKPPGLEMAPDDEGDPVTREAEAIGRLIPNLFRAHYLAREAIHKVNPHAKVGANPNVVGLPYPIHQRLTHPRQFPTFQREAVGKPGDLAALGRRSHAARGSADLVVASLSQTVDRSLKASFSDVYFVAGQLLLVKRGAMPPQLEQLTGEAIAVVQTSTASSAVVKLSESGVLPGARQTPFASYEDALKAVESGAVKALLADNVILRDLMLAKPDRPGKFALLGLPETPAQQVPALPSSYYELPLTPLSLPAEWFVSQERTLPLTREYYAVAVPRGDRQLQGIVNAAVGRFRKQVLGTDYGRELLGADLSSTRETAGDSVLPSSHKSDVGAENALRQGRIWQGSSLGRIRKRGKVVVAVRADVFDGEADNRGARFVDLERGLAEEIARAIFDTGERSSSIPIESRIEYRWVRTNRRLPSLHVPLGPLLSRAGLVYDQIARLAEWAVDFLGWFQQVNAIRRAPFLFTDWWHLGMAGELPEALCPREAQHSLDYVGFDYYWGVDGWHLRSILDLFLKASAGLYDQAPVFPGAMYNWIRTYAQRFPNKEILIVENGSVPNASGTSRSRYIGEHIAQVRKAIADGYNVRGYICWSITSNREWGLRFGKGNDFGLYRIALDDPHSPQTRERTESADTYEALIQECRGESRPLARSSPRLSSRQPSRPPTHHQTSEGPE